MTSKSSRSDASSAWSRITTSDVSLHFLLLRAYSDLLQVKVYVNDRDNWDVVVTDRTLNTVDRLASLAARLSNHDLLRRRDASTEAAHSAATVEDSSSL